MTDIKKVVFSCYLIGAVLAWLVLNKLAVTTAQYFDIYAFGNYVDVVLRLFPVVGAGTLMGVLYRYKKANTYMTEAVMELKKVSVPTSNQVWAATFAVIVAVLISAVLLWLFDSIWSFLIQKVVH